MRGADEVPSRDVGPAMHDAHHQRDGDVKPREGGERPAQHRRYLAKGAGLRPRDGLSARHGDVVVRTQTSANIHGAVRSTRGVYGP